MEAVELDFSLNLEGCVCMDELELLWVLVLKRSEWNELLAYLGLVE